MILSSKKGSVAMRVSACPPSPTLLPRPPSEWQPIAFYINYNWMTTKWWSKTHLRTFPKCSICLLALSATRETPRTSLAFLQGVLTQTKPRGCDPQSSAPPAFPQALPSPVYPQHHLLQLAFCVVLYSVQLLSKVTSPPAILQSSLSSLTFCWPFTL